MKLNFDVLIGENKWLKSEIESINYLNKQQSISNIFNILIITTTGAINI
jgi:hypothetical protein